MTMAAPQTGTELRRSGIDYLAGAAATYVAMALSFGLAVLLTRTLGVAGYGQAALMLTAGQAMAFFATFWTTAGLWRHGNEAWLVDNGFRRVFWSRNLVLLPSLALVAGGVWWGRERLLGWFGMPSAALGAVVAYALAVILFLTSQFTFQALRRQRRFALWQVADKLSLLAAVWIWAAALREHTWLVVALYAAASGLTGILSFLTLERSHWLPVRTDRATLVRFTRFSWPFIVSLAFGYLSTNWIDLVIIRRYASLADVGQYQLAYQIMGFVQTLPMVSFPVTLPLLVTWQVAGHADGVQLYASRLVPHACVALGAVLVAVLAVLRPLMLTFFGPEFSPAVAACGWLLLGVAWYGVFISGLPLLNLWERTGVILAASITGGIANVAGDLVLVPRWGIQGAAIATLLAQAIGAMVVVAAVRTQLRIPLRPVLLSLAGVTTAFIGCLLIGGAAGYAAGLSGAGLLFWAAVGTGGLFGREEWQWLWSVVMRDSVVSGKAPS